MAMSEQQWERLVVSFERIAKALEGRPATAAAPAAAVAAPKPNGDLPENFPNYGRSKGAPIAGATKDDLDYYAAGARKSLSNPEKARWHQNEANLLAAIEAEIANPTKAREDDPNGGAPDPDSIPF